MRDTRPFRSVLYIPGSNARALNKARTLAADAIIFDLEDAVAADAKEAARETLMSALAEGGYGSRVKLIRINGLETPWGSDDLEAAVSVSPDAILLPKVERLSQVSAIARRLDASSDCARTRIWAMMETPAGILNALAIAKGPRMAGFVLGTNDLAKELGATFRADRLPMMHAIQQCLLAARAAGILCVDGVYNRFKDEEGLRLECEQGRHLGMDGKSLIHPAQLSVANQVFAPSTEEIELAQRHIAAFRTAEESGQGVAVVDGRIVENLHVETARITLARADAIAAMT